MARILDGRRDSNGDYRRAMIDWFDENGVDTTAVDVDSIFVAHGDQEWVVSWNEVDKSHNEYIRDDKGWLQTSPRSVKVFKEPSWLS